MNPRSPNPLKLILHPYAFVLKEGTKIKKDFLDYSLMMLLMHSSETIRSPEGFVPAPTDEEETIIELPF